MNFKRSFLIIVLFFLILGSVNAKITLPSVLASNMVLQQQTQVRLWGAAKVGANVVLQTSWNNKRFTTHSDKNGNWLISVPTPKAGGPYEITVSDGETLRLQNILIGEVWFCSGQSNMEMPIKGYSSMPVKDANEVIARAKASVPIRIFMAERSASKKPEENCVGSWALNEGEGVANASATAYFFAKFLQETLNVPIGIVVSSWGGAQIESFMSKETLQKVAPEFSFAHLEGNEKVESPNHKPCMVYNGMIYPFRNLTFKGMIWYQGESNRQNPEQYHRLFPAFVEEMREKVFNLGQFPFYYVQIAPHKYDGENLIQSAEIREVQLKGLKEIPNSGMAVTMDIPGPSYNIHPCYKQQVGMRLGFLALAKTYGKKGIAYSGPIYKSMEIKGDKIFLHFDHADMGLAPYYESLSGFEIAGANRVFYPAHATANRSKQYVEVSSNSVPNPVAVRYCFRNYVVGSLFNNYGLPASSFRTDDWPLK
ncbi:MAG: sialate O-acetylesterase [Bacteroidaceae bacterium]|nr:sialate O-acetylesterase [Bacteroidaceae bacterium]